MGQAPCFELLLENLLPQLTNSLLFLSLNLSNVSPRLLLESGLLGLFLVRKLLNLQLYVFLFSREQRAFKGLLLGGGAVRVVG
jgi:hypothetical protein